MIDLLQCGNNHSSSALLTYNKWFNRLFKHNPYSGETLKGSGKSSPFPQSNVRKIFDITSIRFRITHFLAKGNGKLWKFCRE